MSSAKNVRFTIASDIPLPPRTTNRSSPLYTALKGQTAILANMFLIKNELFMRSSMRASQSQRICCPTTADASLNISDIPK